MIKKMQLPELDLTIFNCTDVVLADDIISTIDRFYEGNVTKNVLWNLGEADLTQLTSEQVQLIAKRVGTYTTEREQGRTAIIASKALATGLSRMYWTLADMERPASSVKTQVFQSLDEALDWFRE